MGSRVSELLFAPKPLPKTTSLHPFVWPSLSSLSAWTWAPACPDQHRAETGSLSIGRAGPKSSLAVSGKSLPSPVSLSSSGNLGTVLPPVLSGKLIQGNVWWCWRWKGYRTSIRSILLGAGTDQHVTGPPSSGLLWSHCFHRPFAFLVVSYRFSRFTLPDVCVASPLTGHINSTWQMRGLQYICVCAH